MLNHIRTYDFSRMLYCFILYHTYNQLYPNHMDAMILLAYIYIYLYIYMYKYIYINIYIYIYIYSDSGH